MNRKEHGQCRNTILGLKRGRVPDRNAQGWIVQEEKSKVAGKECTRLSFEFEVGFMTQKQGLRNISQNDGFIKEYRDMKNFLSSWLREDTEGTDEEMKEMRKGNKEEK